MDIGRREVSSGMDGALLDEEMKLSTFDSPGLFVAVAEVCERREMDPRREISGESEGGGDREPDCTLGDETETTTT